MLRRMRGNARQAERWLGWLPLKSVWWNRATLLRTLVQRELEARYKGSVLGNLWPLLNQLTQLLIYTYVFSIVLQVKLNLPAAGSNHFSYGLWLFAGLLPWTAFMGGFLPAATSVINQPNLVKKVVFPLGLLPLVPIFSAFIESTFGLLVLIIFVGFNSQVVHATLWLLPLIWIPQLLLTAGLGYLVAGLTIFLRDIPQILGLLSNLWFYLTPIVYPISLIPEQWRNWVFWLNPLAVIAEVYRDLILVGEIRHGMNWFLTTLVAIVIFGLGLKCYQKLRPAFADVL